MDSSPHISPAQRPPRRRAACQFCHQSKLKCSRGQPCLRCQINQRECHYELASRIGKPRGSKNVTSSRPPRPRAAGRAAMAKASVDALSNEGEKRSIAPCANMINIEFSDPADEPQHQLLLQTCAGPSWAYSPSDLGQSNSMTPSLITSSPSENSTTGNGFDLLSHANLMDFPTPESFLNSIPSLPEDDPHYSQTSSVSLPQTDATNPPQHSRPTSDDSKPNWWSPAHSPTTCACLASLSASIIPLSSPYPSSVPYTLDTFLSSTSTLLNACNNFLSCLDCPKNSLGLCLAATAFVTFNQLFTSLSKKSHTNSPINDASPAALVLGTYHVPASDSSAVRALMLKLTAQRWRETCVGIRKLLSEMSAKAEKGEEDELAGNGEGVDGSGQRGLWTGRDIDFFRQLVLRVDRELVVFCRKAEGRE